MMRRKIWMMAGAAALCLSLTGLASAANPIQLIVNGAVVDADVSPEIKNGRTMVPIRWVAEALGADVAWDEERRTVSIHTNESNAQQQISLLQEGFKATTAREAVETWAEAVKQRNGAVQFAVLSPGLQEKTRSQYESIHWVTGISSPWVDEYDIIEEAQPDGETYRFNIEFDLKTSTGDAGSESAALTVKESDGVWHITHVEGDVAGVPNA